jgi:hypothetical protein
MIYVTMSLSLTHTLPVCLCSQTDHSEPPKWLLPSSVLETLTDQLREDNGDEITKHYAAKVGRHRYHHSLSSASYIIISIITDVGQCFRNMDCMHLS